MREKKEFKICITVKVYGGSKYCVKASTNAIKY